MTNFEIQSKNIWNNIQNLQNNARVELNNILKKFNIDSKFEFGEVSDRRVNIQWLSGETWSNGTPRYNKIEFSFGDTLFGDKFNFYINPYSAGSFDPTGDSYLRDYYGLTGFICWNTEFTNDIKTVLFELTEKVNPLREELYKISEEERKAKVDAERKSKEAAELEEFNKVKNEYINSEFTLIIKNEGGKFIYRKQPVKVATYGDYTTCCKKLNEITRSRYSSVKASIVETSKVKVAA